MLLSQTSTEKIVKMYLVKAIGEKPTNTMLRKLFLMGGHHFEEEAVFVIRLSEAQLVHLRGQRWVKSVALAEEPTNSCCNCQPFVCESEFQRRACVILKNSSLTSEQAQVMHLLGSDQTDVRFHYCVLSRLQKHRLSCEEWIEDVYFD